MSETLANPFTSTVKTFHKLIRPVDFLGDEEIRILPQTLTGDFNSLAVRLATVFDKNRTHIPMAERTGHFTVYLSGLATNWKILLARYNPFGGMNKDEKLALDTVMDDLSFTVNFDCNPSHLGVFYSNTGDENTKFHQDYGGKGRLLRSYNIAATEYVHREDVLGAIEGKENAFRLKEDVQIHRLKIGDYSYHRHREERDEGCDLKRGLYHRAQAKQSGPIPRMLLCNDL